MSDAPSPLGRALTGLAALLGLAAPACVEPPETSSKTASPAKLGASGAPTSSSSAGPRRPAIDRERPPRVATATFALG